MPARRKPLELPYYGHHPRGAHNRPKPKPLIWDDSREYHYLLTLKYDNEQDRNGMDEWLTKYFDPDRTECICK